MSVPFFKAARAGSSGVFSMPISGAFAALYSMITLTLAKLKSCYIQMGGGANRAVFPGSFDPLTHGHTDIIDRALKLFGHLTVAVLSNPQKSTLFTVEERLAIMREELSCYGERVAIESFSGLLVDFARARAIDVIVRGLRAVSDYDYEAQMALMNKNLCESVETLFLVTREENSYISSSLVKQVASMGGAVGRFVPASVERKLREKLAKKI